MLERDIVLVEDDCAYIFEVKSLVPSLNIRRLGEITAFVGFFEKIVYQASTAANAFVAGTAYYDKSKTCNFPPIKRVYPCGIGYEYIPFRYPLSNMFEEAMEERQKRKIFQNSAMVAPTQFFDIEQVEAWDELFDLENEPHALFKALQTRAENSTARYQSIAGLCNMQNNARHGKGIVCSLAADSEKSTAMRLQQLQR